MFTSEKTIILSIILLVASMGAFLYSNAYAKADPVTCPICSGQSEPIQDMECVDVNLGGAWGCYEIASGDCWDGPDCDDDGPVIKF